MQKPRHGTRMARIAQIFTDPCASRVVPVDVVHKYSARHMWRAIFYHIPSVFICVHPQLIFISLSNIANEIKFDQFPIQRNRLIDSLPSSQSLAVIIFTNFAFFAVRILRLSIIFAFENHRDPRVHREQWQSSAFFVNSVVNCLCNLDQRRIYEGAS